VNLRCRLYCAYINQENIWSKEGLNDRILKKPHNEELHNLYSSPNIIIMIKLRRIICSKSGEKVLTNRVSVGKPEGNTQAILDLGKENISMDPREIRSGGTDWIHLTQDRGQSRAPVSSVMNLRAQVMFGNS
jgi:hypothetical protein